MEQHSEQQRGVEAAVVFVVMLEPSLTALLLFVPSLKPGGLASPASVVK